MRGQLGLDTMGNLVMDVDNIIERCRLVCLPCCACHLMPHRQLQSSADYEHLKKLRACACSRLAGRLAAGS
jgi:hypothetical protein